MSTDKKSAQEFLDKPEEVAQPHMSEADLNQCEIIGDPQLAEQVVKALATVFDPEIPVNIYDLGLIYKIDIDADKHVKVDMTLTAPGCPVAHTFPGQVEATVADVPEVASAQVTLVWDPPWTTARMTEAAKLELGLF